MRADGHEEEALQALLRAIASGDGSAASRLLARAPALARRPVAVGATRAAARAYFFPAIAHYAYAGDTALHMAAAAHQPGIAEELIAMGASVGARNRRGAEPLHYAADGTPASDASGSEAQHAVVELLIRAGADPRAVDKSGVAPLHRAVRTRSAAAVRALLAHGADPRSKNGNGSTPLHLAIQDTGRGGSGSEASRAAQAEIIRLLLDNGARPTDRNGAGRSVKDCARSDWIRALLQRT